MAGVTTMTSHTTTDEPGASVVVCEVMVVTPAIANMIREGENHRIDGAIQTGIETYGMQPYDLGLARAVVSGKISFETALAACHNEGEMRDYMKVASRDLSQP